MGHTRTSTSNGSRVDNVICHCGIECHVKTAQAVRNCGRKYYSCPRYRDADGGCGFFIWKDGFANGFASKKVESEVMGSGAAVDAKLRKAEMELIKARAKIEMLKADVNRYLVMGCGLFVLVCILAYAIAGKN